MHVSACFLTETSMRYGAAPANGILWFDISTQTRMTYRDEETEGEGWRERGEIEGFSLFIWDNLIDICIGKQINIEFLRSEEILVN